MARIFFVGVFRSCDDGDGGDADAHPDSSGRGWAGGGGGAGSCDWATRFPEFACYKPHGAHDND